MAPEGRGEHLPSTRLVLIAASVVAGFALAFLVLTLTGAVPGSSQDRGRLLVDGPLITGNRDRLEICVQPVNLEASEAATVGTQAKESVETALAKLASENPVWLKFNLSEPSPVVDLGCAASPALFDGQAGPISDFDPTVRGREVNSAGPYRTFVYVVGEADLPKGEPDARFRVTSEELICRGEVCGPVTTGIYLDTTEVTNPAFVLELLDDALGLASDRQ